MSTADQCACGHNRSEHHWSEERGVCFHLLGMANVCRCDGFTPAQPATCTHGNDLRYRCEDCAGWTDMGDDADLAAGIERVLGESCELLTHRPALRAHVASAVAAYLHRKGAVE